MPYFIIEGQDDDINVAFCDPNKLCTVNQTDQNGLLTVTLQGQHRVLHHDRHHHVPVVDLEHDP
jgi:hypothetical protein